MSKIYENQTLTLTLDLKDALTGATKAEIRYKKPAGAGSGAWAATISGTTIVCDIPINTLTPTGEWKLQGYAEGVGWSLPGETVAMTVYKLFA